MNVMTFKKVRKKAIDIKQVWVSTNTVGPGGRFREVIIIQNIKDKYELWLEDDKNVFRNNFRNNELVDIYDTFDIAVQSAEEMEDMVEVHENLDW